MVSVSKTKAARDSFVDSGVEEKERMDDSRCERMVVLPEPDSPLKTYLNQRCSDVDLTTPCTTHRNTTA